MLPLWFDATFALAYSLIFLLFFVQSWDDEKLTNYGWLAAASMAGCWFIAEVQILGLK